MRHVNNVMVLEIDDKGILAKKDFFDINDMKDIDFDQNRSESLQKRNFIYNFLSSLRQRVNDPLGVRKKKRQQKRKRENSRSGSSWYCSAIPSTAVRKKEENVDIEIS